MIELLLVRHGEALAKEEDPARPLTPRGQSEVTQVAARLVRLGVGVDYIVHSGKLRAAQTADLLAEWLAPSRGVGELTGLDPHAEPGLARASIEARSGKLAVVGHLPHLGRLASLLVVGDADKGIVTLGSAAALGLVLGPDGWRVRLLVVPEPRAGS
jgi:phosphohistidine phosphatase